jgi:hypothetical protein
MKRILDGISWVSEKKITFFRKSSWPSAFAGPSPAQFASRFGRPDAMQSSAQTGSVELRVNPSLDLWQGLLQVIDHGPNGEYRSSPYQPSAPHAGVDWAYLAVV